MTTGLDFDALGVDDVTRVFGRRRAVAHVSFTAPTGSIVGLLGHNGAGKSTLLAMLATLMRPTSGRITYGTHTLESAGASLRSAIGILGHDLFLYPELSARENLLFFAGLYGDPTPAETVRLALDQAGLSARSDDPVSSLSRGMRQRVALERALIHRPRLVLLDEPFTGLDDASAHALLARLRTLRESGAIVVVATHDLDLADGLLDQVLFLRDGRVVDRADGSQALRHAYRAAMGLGRA